MGRTKNARNRPKFCLIKLSDLCRVLSPDTRLPVEIKYIKPIADINNLDVEYLDLVPAEVNTPNVPKEKIEFTIINPE